MSNGSGPPKIVILGGINMDLIGVTSRMPAPGETIVGEQFYTAPGGKGGNQAVGAARLGAQVSMVGRVGDDEFGLAMLADLRDHGIDVNGVGIDPDNTSGIAMILLDSDRQNHIIAIYGANAACDQTQLLASVEAMEDADALMLQLETPAQVSLAAAQHAKSIGVQVVWDPAPALGMPYGSYQSVDVLTPNQGEAEALTGVKVTDLDSANKAADTLLGLGVPKVVVKLGEQGVYYAGQGERGHVDAFSVEAVDTIAAGDAFGAAFTVALCEGQGLGEAVRFGAGAGALAVTKLGAQEAMPFRSELEEFIGQVGL